MRGFFGNLATSLIVLGFFIFGGGAIFTIIKLSSRYRTPIEFTIGLLGLTLILLGFMAAKIFSEVEV